MESVISCLSTSLKWAQAPAQQFLLSAWKINKSEEFIPSAKLFIMLYQGNRLNNILTYFESVLSNKISENYTE
jgi:hypothetical protein